MKDKDKDKKNNNNNIINSSSNENTGNGKKAFLSKWPLSIRIISLVLVILLVGEIILSNAASVRFSSDEYAESDYEDAANYLEENDEYLSADSLSRMRTVVRTLGEPRNYDEYSLFASVAIADQDYAQAIRYLDTCVELYEDKTDLKGLAELYVKIGCLWALQADWNMGLAKFKKGTETDPSLSSGWLMLCEAYLQTGDYEKALNALDTYCTLETPDTDQITARATLLLSLGRYEEAEEACNTALEMENCDRASLLFIKAECLCIMGKVTEAKAAAEESRKAGTEENQINALLGLCQEVEGDYAGALETYKKLLADDPSSDLSVYEQALQCAYFAGDYAALIDIGTKALTLDPAEEQEQTIRQLLGIAQFEEGLYAEAEENLTVFIEGNSNVPELYYLRGISRMASSDYAGAESDFTAALAADGLTDECLYNRALCRIQLEKVEEAAVDFQEIIDRDASPNIVQMTCELLGIDQENLDEVKTGSQQEVDSDSDSAIDADTEAASGANEDKDKNTTAAGSAGTDEALKSIEGSFFTEEQMEAFRIPLRQ